MKNGTKNGSTAKTRDLIGRIMELKNWKHLTDASKWITKGKNHNYLTVYLRQQTKDLWPFIDRLVEDGADLNVYFNNPIKRATEEEVGKLKKQLEESIAKQALATMELKQIRERAVELQKELLVARDLLKEKEGVVQKLQNDFLLSVRESSELIKSVVGIVNNLPKKG
jgi:hypothetical protein